MKNKLLYIGVGVGIVIVLITGFWVWHSYTEYQMIRKNPSYIAEKEIQAIVQKISVFMTLPSEKPDMATVANIKALAREQFFHDAKNGDKVLVFTASKKAILYRPSTNRVINFAPVLFTVSEATTEPVTLTILNGTSQKGAAEELKNKIKDAQGIAVTATGNTKGDDYKETLVIPLTPKGEVSAERIAELVGGKKSKLPPQEEAPRGNDILIIVGRTL